VGTPEQILEKVSRSKEQFGDYEQLVEVSFGGMPFGMVEQSYKLFASEVLPELKKL
jgi:hypothetical protein